jgi:hypothetical protein
MWIWNLPLKKASRRLARDMVCLRKYFPSLFTSIKKGGFL